MELTAFALELADAADRISMRHFRKAPRVYRKPDRTFVTQADTAIELELRQRIATRYPTHGVLAEEFGDRTSNQETRWIIDPIDGTHNYMRGVPVCATLTALERAGAMELGRISAPAMHERGHAVRGGGGWSGERSLQRATVAGRRAAQACEPSRPTVSSTTPSWKSSTPRNPRP